MVWDINYMFMETKLQSMAKQPMVTEEAPQGYINYMWPSSGPHGGRHISFEVKPKGQFFDFEGHTFYKRQHSVPQKVLESAYVLSDLLYVPTYEEIKDALEAGLQQPVGGAHWIILHSRPGRKIPRRNGVRFA